MDSWQKRHVVKNKPELLENTICSETLLSLLEAGGVLGKADLAAVRCEKNKLTQTAVLYDTVETRVNGYGLMCVALAKCGQTGSFDILMKGLVQNLLSKYESQTKETDRETTTTTTNDIVQKLQTHITPDAFIKLYQQTQSDNLNDLKLVKDTIPLKDANYLSRYLCKKVTINQSVFTAECPDLFVFKNIGHYKLSQLLKPQRAVPSSSKINDRLPCRFIYLDEDVHWEVIRHSDGTKVPAHLLKFEASDKTWILEDSTCNSKILSQYVIRERGSVENQQHDIIIPEDQFVNNILTEDNNVGYCICDSPGMGKTYLLASLARKVALQHPEKLVAFVRLSDLMKKIETKKNVDIQSSSMELVLEYLCTSPLSFCILKELFLAGILHAVLFLDGLDEVDYSQTQSAENLLKCLASGTSNNNTRIFVTSRPHLRQELEASLGVIAYDILPFSRKNQCTYLVALWKSMKISENETKLSEFAGFCLEKFESNSTSDERKITGIPLQCRLLAEVYAEKAKIFAHSKFSKNMPLEDSFTLANLYVEYMKLGLERCFTLVKCFSLVQKVKHYHFWVALKTLFPSMADKFSRKFGINTTCADPNVFSLGMLEKSSCGESAEFVHRTFAELMAAHFFTSAVKKQKPFSGRFRKKFQKYALKFLFDTVLMTGEMARYMASKNSYPKMFHYDIVAYFFNFILKEDPQLHVCINAIPKHFFEADRFYNLIGACIRHNHANIFSLVTNTVSRVCQRNHANVFITIYKRLLSSLKVVYSVESLTFSPTQVSKLVEMAVWFSSLSLVEKLFSFLFHHFEGDISKDVDLNRHDALNVAVNCREYQLVEYLLDQTSWVPDRKLFANCVMASYDDSEPVVQRKLDICRLLLDKNENALKTGKDEQDTFSTYSVHILLLKFLIMNGLNPCTSCTSCMYTGTLVHHAADYMDNNDFHEFCRFIIEDCQLQEIFEDDDQHAWTNMLHHIILTREDTQAETIRIILDNTKTHHKENKLNVLIHMALAARQKVEIVDTLISYSTTGGTMLASKVFCDGQSESLNNIADISSYLPFLNIDSNPIDKEGNTLLHIVSKHYEPDRYHQIIEFLCKNGHSDLLTITNAKLELPIHAAVEHMEILEDTLKLFSKSGVCFNALTKNDDSLLMIAVRKGQSVQFLKTLIEMGADVKLKKGNGDMFVHHISVFYSGVHHHEIVEMLIDMGHADIFGIFGRYGKSPIHLAALNQALLPSTVDLLVTKANVDLNSPDKNGCSVLSLAMRETHCLVLVTKLVELGADWTVKNTLGMNMALVSAYRGLFDHLKYFVSLGCNVNELDEDGNNALHLVILYGMHHCDNALDIIQFLVAKGVNKMHLNTKGKTAHMIAIEKGVRIQRILNAIQ